MKLFDALLRRKMADDDRQRLNAGFIYAAVCNSAWGDPARDPAQPTDIVPSMAKKKGPPDLRTMTPEEQKAYLDNMFMGAGKRSMRK